MHDKIDNKSPFAVPENYFEEFNTRLLNNLPQQKLKEKTPHPLWQIVTKWVAVAAVVSGFAFLGIDYLETTSQKNNQPLERAIAGTKHDASDPSLNTEYYEFLEDAATRLAINETFYNDDNF